MQRNEKSQDNEENSTSKIWTKLGGRPAQKPIFAGRKKVYEDSEEIKIDENGEAYMGKSIHELQKDIAEDQKNINTISSNETSSEKSTQLGKGGPPAKPPVFGAKVRVYDGSEEIKIDKDGCPYIGLSLDELKILDAERKNQNTVSPNETPSEDDKLQEIGIFRLSY